MIGAGTMMAMETAKMRRIAERILLDRDGDLLLDIHLVNDSNLRNARLSIHARAFAAQKTHRFSFPPLIGIHPHA